MIFGFFSPFLICRGKSWSGKCDLINLGFDILAQYSTLLLIQSGNWILDSRSATLEVVVRPENLMSKISQDDTIFFYSQWLSQCLKSLMKVISAIKFDLKTFLKFVWANVKPSNYSNIGLWKIKLWERRPNMFYSR